MLNCLPLSPQAQLVFKACAVLSADKNLFLRPLRKEPLPAADRQERSQIQAGIRITTLPFTAMKKSSLLCPLCGQAFHHRVKRPWVLRYALYFMPVKIYFCDHCEKNVYVLIKDLPDLSHKPAW